MPLNDMRAIPVARAFRKKPERVADHPKTPLRRALAKLASGKRGHQEAPWHRPGPAERVRPGKPSPRPRHFSRVNHRAAGEVALDDPDRQLFDEMEGVKGKYAAQGW